MNSSTTSGVVYADVSGATRLIHKLGATEAGYAVDRAVKRMERAIGGFGGRVIRSAADQWIAAFDSAGAAVEAAIEMQDRVADMLAVSGVRLTIRIGVHCDSGENEAAREEATEIARRLLTMAGPSQILTSATTARYLPPPLSDRLWSCEGLSLMLPGGEEEAVYRVQWADVEEMSTTQRMEVAVESGTPPASDSEATAGGRFCVRAAGRAYLVDERTSLLAIGRDKRRNDIVISDPKASREHARIERRGDGRCVLVDTSTNGTFVLDGTAETKVLGGEILLGARGKIAFGHSPRDHGAECLEFERLA